MEPVNALAAEQWVWSSGLSPWLVGDPIRLTRFAEKRVQSLPARMRDAVKDMFEKKAKAAPVPAFNWERVSAVLFEPLNASTMEGQLDGFPPHLAPEIGATVSRAVDYLKQAAPKSVNIQEHHPETREPSAAALDRFRRLYGILDDPEQLFAELRENSLTIGQVRGFAEVFPALYQLLTETAVIALSERGSDDDLSHAADKQLQVLTRLRKIKPATGATLQQTLAARQEASDGADVKSPRQDLETAAQRARAL